MYTLRSLTHLLAVAAACVLAACSAKPPASATQPATTDTTDTVQLPATPLVYSGLDQLAEYVVAAFEDSRGHLWFGTMEYGVARYNGDTLVFFTTDNGLSGNTISSIAEDANGNIWFGGHEPLGICRFTPTQESEGAAAFTTFGSTGSSVQTDANGNVWATQNGQILRFNGKGFDAFEIPIIFDAGTSYAIANNRVWFSMEDTQGNWWFGTDGHGALRYNPASNAWDHFTKADGMCSNVVTSMVEDKQGRIWINCMQAYTPTMTGDGGLCRFDGQTFTTFEDVQGLSGTDLYSICVAGNGDVLVGATGLGLYRFSNNEWKLYKGTNRMDLTVNIGLQDICEDKNGTIWVPMSGGLFRLMGDQLINVTVGGPWGVGC